LNRKDWRTISLAEVISDPEELKPKLIPVLYGNSAPGGEDVSIFAQRLVNECRENLSSVYPLSAQETESLNHILAKGKIKPSLITEDADLQDRIMRHPMLLWKAINVRRHFSVGE